MGRTFRDAIAGDVQRVFLNTAEMAIDVIYERSAQCLAFPAIPDEPLFVISEDVGRNTAERLDYLIDPARLDFGEGPVMPKQGDTIRDGERVYTVTPPPGSPLYEWDDEYRTLLRVHTLLTKVRL